MNSGIFISYMNTLKREHVRFVPFYDGTPWHPSGNVEEFMEKNRKTITPVIFLRCLQELNLAEECRKDSGE